MSPTVSRPSFPSIQGAHSTTFTTPPLDRNLTFAEILAFHAEHSATHKLFVYSEDGIIKSIDYATAFRAQKVAASIVKAAFEAGKELYPSDVARPVFGILASADTVTYATVLFGIQQTGAIPFPISTRNSAAAIAHLIRTTGVRQVFLSEDAAMRALASETVDLLAKDGYEIGLLDLPRFEVLYGSTTPPCPTLEDSRIAPLSADALALVLHSSGTSAFPKPIQVNNHNFRSWGIVFYYGEVDVCGTRWGSQAVPMFHAMGTMILTWAVYCGLELAVYKPVRPPVLANPSSFLRDVVETKSKRIMTVPAHIEAWSHDPANLELLKRHVERIVFGGGPLNKQVGDALQAQGIGLDVGYGMRVLFLSSWLETSRPAEWDYFRLPHPDHIPVELVPYDGQDGLLEPVAMVGEHFSPNVINTTVNGKPGFATGDLVQEHPLYKGIYKIFGRADEQIMLSTGEKTNPVPLERILLRDPQVSLAVFFGRGRFNNGVIVQPATPFDSNDLEKVQAFRDAIWPTICRMNEYAPAHSRVLKEMILVTSPEKPLEWTAKGTVRRNVSLAKYEDEIEAIYKAAESSHDGPQRPATWTPETTLAFVHAVVEMALSQKVSENDELFSLGCDSLAASTIRNNIIRALRTTPSVSDVDPSRKVPQTLVYQHSSIRALSDFVFALVTGRDLEPDAEAILEQKVHAMEAMVAKYSVDFPPPRVQAGGPLPEQETVVVTGTTGRLGCHLLAQLIQDPRVHRVYALNRASSGDASPEALRERMRYAFETWELDPTLLQSEKLALFASNYAAERLGLDADTYAAIESQVTTIIHNAWRVDFNVALSGFEPLIAGLRRLIELASNSPVPGGARLLFVSSISVLLSTPSDRPALEEPIVDARISAGFGYAESKWVAETLLLRARDAVGLRSAAVRVGQMSGDTRVGGWNKQEWVGAIARLGQIVQALPMRDEPVTWVPVDIAATALIDMTRSEEPCFNLVAPVASDWQTVFGAFAERLNLPLIKYEEWAARVTAAAERNTSSEDTQPFALAQFFQEGNFGEGASISTTRACKVSPTLAKMSPVGAEDVALYVDFWKKIGFLHA
ncbi:unnamed protein product [Peniophora sp. CBMAI 1063]|nr:unnamed protein product [Peniophora sp. CBMAI 1063]